jgi:hypothetical protein
MTLDNDQRRVFTQWLDERISDNDALVEQLRIIDAPTDAFAQRMLAESEAYAIVRDILQSGWVTVCRV